MFKNKKNIALVLLLTNSVLMGSDIGEDALKQFEDDVTKRKKTDDEPQEKGNFDPELRQEIKDTVQDVVKDVQASIQKINLISKVSMASSVITAFVTIFVFGVYMAARNQ